MSERVRRGEGCVDMRTREGMFEGEGMNGSGRSRVCILPLLLFILPIVRELSSPLCTELFTHAILTFFFP